MTRVRKVDLEREKVRKGMEQFVGTAEAREERRKRREAARGRGPTASSVRRFVEQAREMMTSGDWSEAKPHHMVGLYMILYEECYRVPPSELVGREFMGARSSAARMLSEVFRGEVGELVEFIKWTWRREFKTEEWRRAHRHDGGVVAWRDQFQKRNIVTRYKISLHRMSK